MPRQLPQQSKKGNSQSPLLVGYLIILLGAGTIFIFLWIIGKTFWFKRTPYLPRTDYGTPEDVIIKPVNLNTVKLKKEPLFKNGNKVAVFQFSSPNQTQGGSLISDMFSSLLQEKGFNVVERNNIEQILREQKIVGEGRTTLNDLGIAQRLGKLIAADYMVFGAVTLYQTEPQAIYLPIKIRTTDRDEYEKEYLEYRDWFVNNPISFWIPKSEKIKKLRTDYEVLSLDELDNELVKTSRIETRVISSVGISVKIVDVKNVQIIWLGQGETNDFTSVSATRRILEEFFKSIQN